MTITDATLKQFSRDRKNLTKRCKRAKTAMARGKIEEMIESLDAKRNIYKVRIATVVVADNSSSSSSSSGTLTESSTTQGVIATESKSVEDSVSSTATTGNARENRRTVEVETKDAAGNMSTKRVIDTTTDTAFQTTIEEQRHVTTMERSMHSYRTDSLLTITMNDTDSGGIKLFREFIRLGEPSFLSIPTRVVSAVMDKDYDDPMPLVLLWSVNAAEQCTGNGGWHAGAYSRISFAYDVAAGDNDMCTNPLMLPCVIAHQWKIKSFQWLAENLFALDPINVIRDHATAYLERRFKNDLKHVTEKYEPQEPTMAYVAVNGTRRTGLTYDQAREKLRTEIVLDATNIGKGNDDYYIDEKLQWRDAELDEYAKPEHYEEIKRHEEELKEIEDGHGPQAAQLRRFNANSVDNIVEAFLTGYGTLLTTKLLSLVTDPESTDTTANVVDVAPGTLMKADTPATVVTNVDTTVTRANGGTVKVSTLSATLQRDIHRGVGVDNIVVTRNPSSTRDTSIRQSHTLQMPKTIDYTRVIGPNGTMDREDYRLLVAQDKASIPLARNQQVVTMDVRFYSNGPDYKEYVVRGVRVCPAPPSIIAMYKRTAAMSSIRRDYAMNIDVRANARVETRKRDTRDEEIRRIATERVAGLRGLARDRELQIQIDRLTYDRRQAAIRRKL
jgi:hypothetical protein